MRNEIFDLMNQRGLSAAVALVLATVSGYAASSTARPGDKEFTAAEVMAHNRAESCYIIIDGIVYDVTPVLKEHAAQHEYNLVKWCGKESTKGWNEKDGKGMPHSRKAAVYLRPLRVGVLAQDPPRP